MRPRVYRAILLALLVVHAATLVALMAWLPWTTDEPFYLETGVALRQTGEWRTFHSILHGPLPFYANQLFAWAAPVEPWQEFKFWGRLGMLPFALVAAVCIAGLAREAFGARAALFALVLHCANPVVLANAPLMTTDMALAAGYVATAWAAFRFLRAPGWPRLLVLGGVLGLAFATKYTALFLPVSLVLVLLVALGRGFAPRLWCSRVHAGLAARAADALLATLVAGAIAWLTLHACYGFRAGGYVVREPPAGVTVSAQDPRAGPLSSALQRAVQVPLAPALLRLLPEPLVRGLDFQKLQSEQPNRQYFAGRYAERHPWYFVAAFALKLPLAVLVLILLGLALPRLPRAPPFGLLVVGLLVPPLWFLSFRTNLQGGIRYALQLLPLLTLVAARGAEGLARRRAAGIALLVVLAAGLCVFHITSAPRHGSAFNVLAGSRPWRWFADSTLDWPGAPAASPDPDLLRARHPGAERLPRNVGPRFGRHVAWALDLVPPDPEHQGRARHWLDAFTPADRLGAWFLFEVDEATFAEAAAADARVAADYAVALVGAGRDLDATVPPIPAAMRARLDEAVAARREDPDGPRFAAALLELGRLDLVAAHEAFPALARARAWLAMDQALHAVVVLQRERDRRALDLQEGLTLATALFQRNDPERALAVLAEQPLPADPAGRAMYEQVRARLQAAIADQERRRR